MGESKKTETKTSDMIQQPNSPSNAQQPCSLAEIGSKSERSAADRGSVSVSGPSSTTVSTRQMGQTAGQVIIIQ